jgi:hypothetical protein
MAAYARHHLLPFGNYTLHYLADPSLEKTGSDKKNKGIGSRETGDCFPWVLSWIVIGYIYIWRLWLDVLVVQKLLTPIFISLLAMESVSLNATTRTNI